MVLLFCVGVQDSHLQTSGPVPTERESGRRPLGSGKVQESVEGRSIFGAARTRADLWGSYEGAGNRRKSDFLPFTTLIHSRKN